MDPRILEAARIAGGFDPRYDRIPEPVVRVPAGLGLSIAEFDGWLTEGSTEFHPWSAVMDWTEDAEGVIQRLIEAMETPPVPADEWPSVEGFPYADVGRFRVILRAHALVSLWQGRLDDGLEAIHALGRLAGMLEDAGLRFDSNGMPDESLLLMAVACRREAEKLRLALIVSGDRTEGELVSMNTPRSDGDWMKRWLWLETHRRRALVARLRTASDLWIDELPEGSRFAFSWLEAPPDTLRGQILGFARDTMVPPLDRLNRMWGRIRFPFWRFVRGDRVIADILRRRPGLVESIPESPKVGLDRLSAAWPDFERMGSGEACLWWNALGTEGPMDQMLQMEVRSRALRALNDAGVAVIRYARRHGQYPAALEQLVPGFISETPADPRSGRALGYSRDREVGFRLHTAHPDGTDPFPAGISRDRMESILGSEIVWPVRPATPAAMKVAREQALRIRHFGRQTGLPHILAKRFGLLPEGPAVREAESGQATD